MNLYPMDKDLIMAVLGASAALAGLVLVFLGVVITAYQSFSGDTAPRVLHRYQRAGWWTLGSFLLSLAAVFVSFVWLIVGGETTYRAAVVAFILQLIAMTGVAVYATKMLLGD